MVIRKTQPEDLDAVLALYANARAFMARSGNPGQWGGHYPPQELVEADIAGGCSYVCLEGDKLVGTFYFAPGPDPTYRQIHQGAWLDDKEYGVVHRITAAQGTRGVASFCLAWCLERCGNIRIDTHRDNIPMQRALEKNGYTRCGVIHVADGSERLAYQKKAPPKESFFLEQ